MKTSSVIFFGSSPFSVIVLEKVLGFRCQVLGVVTTPDKPAGRHLKLTPNPVKSLALKNNIPVFENITPFHFPPLKLRGGTEEGDMKNPVGLVAAYGKIIPQRVLDVLGGRIYNIHPSLLPKYRGPSPLQQQILDGVTETGVTIIQLDAQMDHGPIVAQEKDIIKSDDTWITLGNRLFSLGANLFLKFLLEPRTYNLVPQDHALATSTQKLTRQSGFVEFEKLKNYLSREAGSRSAGDLRVCDLDIARMLRAYEGWPGVWTLTPDGKRLKLVSLTPPLVQLEGKSPQLWTTVVQ